MKITACYNNVSNLPAGLYAIGIQAGSTRTRRDQIIH